MNREKVMEYLNNPMRLFVKMGRCGFFNWMSDETYLKLAFRSLMGTKANLDNPQTFNEKLTWLKLHYHNPLMTTLADKYRVKQYVAEKIGSEYVVPCYGHWKTPEAIEWDKLPERVFLKTNQDSSGGMVVCKSSKEDMEKVNKLFGKKLRENHYWGVREWAYKHIEPCILAEEYLDEETGHELHDYKFWCFNGKPIYMYITNKGKIVKENFYDMDFNPADINHGFERTQPEYEKPANFEKMKAFAQTLSQGLPFVRMDFFNVKGKLYFSEYTFYDWGGVRPFVNRETDLKLGALLDLSQLNTSK